MAERNNTENVPDALRFLAGDTEMARRICEFDFSNTPLGPVSGWPQSLRSAVNICLTTNFPIVLFWGPQLAVLYNDAYIPMLADKHPWALGKTCEAVWNEIFDVIGPLLWEVMKTGVPFSTEDYLFIMQRKGYKEETHFQFSYGAARDESGAVGGIFCVAVEITDRVFHERRLATLSDLKSDAKNPVKAAQDAAQILDNHAIDVPFSLIYLLDKDGKSASLAGRAGLRAPSQAVPITVDLTAMNEKGWPLARVAASGKLELVSDLQGLFGDIPADYWPDPPHSAAVLPLLQTNQQAPAGLLVLGISPRRAFDEAYRRFFELAAEKITSMIANADAFEQERRRAESLAELDRAKTVFFSNVSHEFRTPLTLLLGPLEEALSESTGLPFQFRERLEIAHRNSLRLLKLVNTLLDFSRIEAGRIQAMYEGIDLGAYTAELASVFRSAIEKAGMRLTIDCPSLPVPVYVDREMWEKIVLNLLSNAFKFTFEGEIAILLRQAGEMVEFEVRDTGTGIPAGELQHLFERFHRVKGARGRSYEGSGIGLALVRELVKLHGGDVRVQSQVDQGTTFTVTIPIGAAHLPAERVEIARPLTSTGLRGEVYVAEALRWLPGGDWDPERPNGGPRIAADSTAGSGQAANGDLQLPRPDIAASPRQTILLADDNADMRDYVRRLLSPSYEVEAVADGLDALHAARERTPDLVLADVMMPRLDGIGLLKTLRADERLKAVPVILLSARAGEEASVEGINSGADDYLIKPFSSRELVARVDSHLKMARLRAEAEAALRESEAKLEIELADAQQLQRISSSLIPENKIDALYDEFLGAACSLMRSDMASLQMLAPDRQELFLLAEKGFAPESAKFWEWVEADDATSCGLVLARGERVIVPDVELWDLVKGTEDLWHYRRSGIRSILSTPLTSRDGRLVGVISTQWRDVHQPSEREMRLLDVLARQAADVIERRQAEEALRKSEKRMRLAIRATRMVTWEWLPAEDRISTSDSFADLYGLPALAGEAEGFALVVPEDRDAHTAKVRKIASEGGSYTSDFRIKRAEDGRIVWLEERAEAQLGPDGKVERVIGVTLDISDRKRAEDRQSLLMSELNHRVKNTLATVQAIASQTLRGSTDPQQFVVSFQARLHALSRAHSLLNQRRWESANVTDLVRDQLTMDGDVDRIKLHGPEALLTPQSAVALALVLHELGTNARKYGALSAPTGRLDVRWGIGPDEPVLQIDWIESGGPLVLEPKRRGFGTTLIEKSLGGVRGSAELRFRPNGLHCAIRVPLSPEHNGHGWPEIR